VYRCKEESQKGRKRDTTAQDEKCRERVVTPSIRKVALFIAVLAGFMTPFDLSAVNIALPASAARRSTSRKARRAV
jgi:hypothetical protein